MSDLMDILARTLVAQGALVEPIHPDGLEIFAPPHIQEALALPEWSRVGFGTALPEQAVRVSFEAEWAQRLMRLLGERGTYFAFDLRSSASPAAAEDLERDLSRAFVLENATFRFREVTPARGCYFLLVFGVTSISDDKREDTLYLCLNEMNGAAVDRLISPLLSMLRADLQSAPCGLTQVELPLALSARRIRERANRLLPVRIRAKVAPFLVGMERRMSRDLERLHAYYSDLRLETVRRIESKKRKGEEPEVVAAEQMRMQAIEREYQAKVVDLDRKYAMSVDVRLTQAVRAQLPVMRVELFLLRRKGIRKLFMDWNPMSKGFDMPPCESCFDAPRTFHVCDDKLHLICSTCMAACPGCAKESCRACHAANARNAAMPGTQVSSDKKFIAAPESRLGRRLAPGSVDRPKKGRTKVSPSK